ncbi:MAG: hypothetical protein N2379_00195 [Verrucomicrobiae bacterium]|nr:hypothetical protein [Verrucomicrobiae bacterium]
MNLILAGIVAALALHKPVRAPRPETSRLIASGVPDIVNQNRVVRLDPGRDDPTALVHYPTGASPVQQRRWLVDQLRGMGVPEKVLARIIIAELEEAWDKRRSEVAAQTLGDPQALDALQLEFEMSLEPELRAALGDYAFEQWDRENKLREALIGSVMRGTEVPLSPAEADAIYELMKKLEQRRFELERARLNGRMDDADVAKAYEEAHAESQRQMREILGEERYALAQGVHPDIMAAELKHELTKVSATDAQFQELLDIQRRLNDARTELDKQFEADPGSPAYAQKLAELEDARRREYERVLGQEAFEALQKQHDGRYLKMRKYAEAWGLDDAKLEHVYAAIRYYEKSVDEYIAGVRALEAQGARVDWAEVNRNLEQFGEQMQRALEGQLGQETFLKLKRNGVLPFSEVRGARTHR